MANDSLTASRLPELGQSPTTQSHREPSTRSASATAEVWDVLAGRALIINGVMTSAEAVPSTTSQRAFTAATVGR